MVELDKKEYFGSFEEEALPRLQSSLLNYAQIRPVHIWSKRQVYLRSTCYKANEPAIKGIHVRRLLGN